MGIESRELGAEIQRVRDELASAEEAASPIERLPLDAVLRGVVDGVTVLDATGRMIYANDAAARMCGYPDAESLVAAPPGR